MNEISKKARLESLYIQEKVAYEFLFKLDEILDFEKHSNN